MKLSLLKCGNVYPNIISLLWLLSHSGLSMSSKILESISELSTLIVISFTKRYQFYLSPKSFLGGWWVVSTNYRVNLQVQTWDLRMTLSIYWPFGLLELTMTWSGPRAWQKCLVFKNLFKVTTKLTDIDKQRKLTWSRSLLEEMLFYKKNVLTYKYFSFLDSVYFGSLTGTIWAWWWRISTTTCRRKRSSTRWKSWRSS